MFSAADYQRIQAIFLKLDISGALLKELDKEAILAATRSDKKAKAGTVRYVLLKKIGQVSIENGLFAHPVEDDIVRKALLQVCKN